MSDAPSAVYVLPGKIGGVLNFVDNLLTHRRPDGWKHCAILTRNRLDNDTPFAGTVAADLQRRVEYSQFLGHVVSADGGRPWRTAATEEVMTILAEMVAARDPAGHCELCHGDCVKGSLQEIGLSAVDLRGKALNYYLRVLDRLGIPGATSLAWVANLPV